MIRPAGSKRSKRTVVTLMIANAVALAIPLIAFYYFLMRHEQIDLDVYRIGATVWRNGGDLYGPMPVTQSGKGLPFTYPPIAAVLLSPLTLVPMKVAGSLLGLLTIGLVAVVLGVFLRSLGFLSNDRLRWAVTALLPVALVLEPVRSTLGFGQVNVVLMALVAGVIGTTWGMVSAVKSEREAVAERKTAEDQRSRAVTAEAEARNNEQKARANETKAEWRLYASNSI